MTTGQTESGAIAAEAREAHDGYSLARTPEEYERLRAQARVWEPATGRLLDRVGLAPGSHCLDAGCGPGETMRLMAQRMGPSGRVVGVDADGRLGREALAAPHGAGHHQCEFEHVDLTRAAPAGAQFDLVYARLLLYHLPERVAVLRRLWDAVAPGGHLLVQDYDLRSVGSVPSLESVDELGRILIDAFSAAGCDVHAGSRLPELFARAGIGEPDGTDVAGRLEPLGDAQRMLVGVYQGLLPTALARGVTTEERSAALLSDVADDVERLPHATVVWPLLIGAWKHKPAAEPRTS